MFMLICENGYARSLDEARMMTARDVLQCYDRIKYKADYEAAFWWINRPKDK